MAGGVVFKFGPDLSATGWRYVSFPRRRAAAFEARGEDAVVVEAKASVGLLWHPVPQKLAHVSKARWRWRVAEGVGPTDLTRKGGDDRALAVYFAFANPEVSQSETDLMTLLRQGRGHLLIYVWGGAEKPGTVLPLPHFDGRGRSIVKRDATTKVGVWFDELAEVRADFRRAFGHTPGRLVAVAISSDSDDTGGRNVAVIADLCVK